MTPRIEHLISEENKVCMISYNSRGFSDIKVEFMKFLLSNSVTGNRVPILCNQENFMLRENAFKLRQALPDYQLLINPAVKKDLTRKTK